MLKEKISLKRLVGLSQEDGEKLLLAAGYIQDNTYCDDEDCIEGQRYHDDTYYSLYDEDGQEIENCPHPGMKVFIDVGIKLDEYDIMRIEK